MVRHIEPETRRQSTDWHRPQFPRKKKLKMFPSAGKVMITVFGDCEGVILVDPMPRGKTVNADAYIRTLAEIRKRFKRVRPHKIPM
ncbi:hypothetical protein Cfor_12302 [Coptotermes formosanus]|jgi:hypothetical protein|uniref:Uncharacterized protein n=1 Tax=Coptotermes formosanus TaxID=36987 RepID=A0A6L2PQJ0_COPFO|nr:hypothetical protein Cfor_12302 [Coptotermes formosanus]